jgi:hypothetical protein
MTYIKVFENKYQTKYSGCNTGSNKSQNIQWTSWLIFFPKRYYNEQINEGALGDTGNMRAKQF